jgi:hypothetical protein
MVQAENNNSGISNFQLANCSWCDHHSLAHLSKFTLSGPERLPVTGEKIVRSKAQWDKTKPKSRCQCHACGERKG